MCFPRQQCPVLIPVPQASSGPTKERFGRKADVIYRNTTHTGKTSYRICLKITLKSLRITLLKMAAPEEVLNHIDCWKRRTKKNLSPTTMEIDCWKRRTKIYLSPTTMEYRRLKRDIEAMNNFVSTPAAGLKLPQVKPEEPHEFPDHKIKNEPSSTNETDSENDTNERTFWSYSCTLCYASFAVLD
ncbi:hypothetical protein QE152_g4255 [Popillia japonica]|uniref:Uncharacterized protein n=1 Tax=Popillia japonica TaxID=7064 RepID=A0AAW1N0N5_POPJA